MAFGQEPQPVIGSVFPAQPSWEIQKDSPYRTTQSRIGGGESTTPGTEFQAGLGQIDAARAAGTAAIDKVAAVRTDIAGAEAAGAQNQLATAQAADAEREARHKELAPEIARRMAQSKSDIDEFRKMPAPALFADRGAASSVALAIGMAVGAISDAMAARANALLGRANGPSTVSAIINQDIERQREKLATASAKMQQSGKSVAEIQAYEDRLNARLDAKKVRMLETAQLSLQAALKGKGMALADAMKTKEAADLEMETAKARTSLVQNIVDKTEKNQTTTTNVGEQTKTINREPTEKAPTEKLPSVQQQVQFNRIKAGGETVLSMLDKLKPEEREQIYNQIQQDTFFERNPTGALVFQAVTGDQTGQLSPNARAALQAASEAADGEAGITTGAVATPEQIRNKIRRWIPGGSSTKEDHERSKTNINDDVNHIYAPAGHGAKPVQRTAPPGGTPPASAPGNSEPTKPPTRKNAAASIYTDDERKEAEAILRDPKSDNDDRELAIKVLKGAR